jgi:hypothetical protein
LLSSDTDTSPVKLVAVFPKESWALTRSAGDNGAPAAMGPGSRVIASATGAPGVTTIAAVPWTASLVAVTFAVPGRIPVTVPLAFTLAMATLSELHTILRSVSTTPFLSFATACNCIVSKTCSVPAPGVISTKATCGGPATSPVQAASAEAIARVRHERPTRRELRMIFTWCSLLSAAAAAAQQLSRVRDKTPVAHA